MIPAMDLSKRQSKEERIATRMNRINQRRAAQHSTPSSSSPRTTSANTSRLTNSTTPRSSRLSSTQPSPSQQPTQSHAALQSSYSTLSSSLTSSLSHLQSFLRTRQAQQAQQRSEQERLSTQRTQTITDELTQSAQTNSLLHSKLASLASSPTYSTPQSLYLSITSTYKDALSVVQRKDDIIRDLSLVLQSSDDTYMSLLDQHEKDVQSMCQTMTQSAHAYKAQCTEQLTQLQQTMQHERAQLISQFQAELDTLYDKRKKMELNRLDSKIHRERREEKELDELRARDLEDYYALKVELESAIAVFEQQLEDMRNMYNLNAEKLEYNHAILMERDHENKVTVEMYRNKMRKMKELVSQLAVKASEAEKRVNEENKAVSMEYMKLTEQYKGLQKKYAHFIQRDSDMYEEIRAMNEGQCMALAKKLLYADKLITEQVLGREWRIWWKVREGEDDTFDDEDDIARLTPQAIVEGIDAFDKRQMKGEEGVSHTLMGKARYSPAQIKAVLQLLTTECHFLIPTPPQPLPDLDPDPTTSSLIHSSDALLKAIGCEDDEDVDELCSLFYTSPSDVTINIDRNDVSGVVKEFVLHRQEGGAGGGGVRGEGSAQSEKRARRAEKERRWWECLSRVVSEESREVWKGLEGWLVKYLTVLKEREVALKETGELSKQNEELNALLESYKGAKINEELLIPPTTFLTSTPIGHRR